MASTHTQGVEEKVLEQSVEALIGRCRDLRQEIEKFLGKIEHEHATLTWPSVVDSFGCLSGQISSLFTLLRSEKIASLQNYPIIPLKLGQDEDPYLSSITDGRLISLNHAIVPDYLRTKPDPEVEQIERQQNIEANAYNEHTVKTLNKQCDKILERIRNAQQNWKSEGQSRILKSSSNINDTMQLIAASTYGHGLGVRQGHLGLSSMSQTNQLQPGGGKMPSNVAANIKVQPHPYSRT